MKYLLYIALGLFINICCFLWEFKAPVWSIKQIDQFMNNWFKEFYDQVE